MSKSLAEKGLALAQSGRGSSDIGSVWLDRTIHYTVERTDASGNVILDKNGEPLIDNQAYRWGMRVTPEQYDEIMAKEKEFMQLNIAQRQAEEAAGYVTKIKAPIIDMTGAPLF